MSYSHRIFKQLAKACAYAQADLRLCWSHIPHCWKSHVVAHIGKMYEVSFDRSVMGESSKFLKSFTLEVLY